MRQRIATIATCSWLWLVAIVPTALAQRAAQGTRADIQALEKDIDELRAKAVQVPTIATAVEELSARLVALERQLAEREREQNAIPDAITRLDGVEEQVAKLAIDVEAITARLADIEQPWSPEASGGAAGVSYRDGFRWTTADGKHAVTLGGYMQIRYQLRVSDGDIEEATLRLRRARLGISGHVGSERVGYKLLLSALDDRAALDAYVQYAVRGGLFLRVGQYKTRFTRGFITSSTRLAFVERSRVIEGYRYGRDIQVGLRGTLAGQRFGYHAGLGNGSGPNARNDNLDVDANVRLDAVVMGPRFEYGQGDMRRTGRPSLMLGAGVVYDVVAMPDQIAGVDGPINTDVDSDGDRDNVRVLSASVDAVFRYRGWQAAIEGVLRNESFGTILEHPDNGPLLAAIGERDRRIYMGAVGQLTVLLPWQVRVGARAGYSRQPFLGVGGASSEIPSGDHVLEADGMVQLYDRRGVRWLGLQYSFQHRDDDGGDHHQMVLEAQLKL